MTIDPKWFGLGMKNIAIGNIDLDTDAFKLQLHTVTYTPNQDTDQFNNAATNEVANGNGYATGGVALSSVTVTYDSASQQVRWDFADVSWTFTAAKTWRWGTIHKVRGGAETANELVGYINWGADQTVSSPYTLQLDPAGLLYIDVT